MSALGLQVRNLNICTAPTWATERAPPVCLKRAKFFDILEAIKLLDESLLITITHTH
jgi:hypothetical protein